MKETYICSRDFRLILNLRAFIEFNLTQTTYVFNMISPKAGAGESYSQVFATLINKPAVLAAVAGQVGCFFSFFFFFFFCGGGGRVVFFISYILSSFSNASSLGRRLDMLKYCGLGRYNPTIVVSY